MNDPDLYWLKIIILPYVNQIFFFSFFFLGITVRACILHIGHFGFSYNHGITHFLWNLCPHPKRTTLSFCVIFIWQIEHYISLLFNITAVCKLAIWVFVSPFGFIFSSN